MHYGDYAQAEIHTNTPGNPPQTPPPICARPPFAAGDLRPWEFPTALCLPCQVPWIIPPGPPVEPDRLLASSVRKALVRVCLNPVRTPSLSRRLYRLRPDGSFVSRSLLETPV